MLCFGGVLSFDFWVFVFLSWQLRRERIAERMKALQELVPDANKVFILCDCWGNAMKNGLFGLEFSLPSSFVFESETLDTRLKST